MGLVPAKHLVLNKILNCEVAPNKVKDVKPDLYSSRNVGSREDGLILYYPSSNVSTKRDIQFEIVLHRPITDTINQTFSLFRTFNQQDAEEKFRILKDKLPLLVEICKEMYNTSGLQSLCDVLFEHPTWTVAHVAAHFGLNDAFKNPNVNSYINSNEETTGLSPLQIAVIRRNLKTVQVLVASKCSLEHLDHTGSSVFHYAASNTKDIIQALIQNAPPNCLNCRNKNGYTPLHLACLADKPECVRALLLAGADVNKTATNISEDNVEPSYVGNFFQSSPNSILYQNDMKYGGTPLHWACSKSVIDTLIDMNCNIDAVNFQHKTALHVMVLRGRLDCAVALLCRGANPDIGDNEGNRPIHIAVKEGSVSLIQCLVIFGADINILNNKGETARHLVTKVNEAKLLYCLAAAGAKRCSLGMSGCTEGCVHNGTFDGVPPPKAMESNNRDILDQILSIAAKDNASARSVNNQKKGRLLCLDGGGIRGLILVQILLELEDTFGKPIVQCFDWLAGTSTGGILALGIATGRTMRECLRLYFRLKEMTFVGMRPYPSDPLENILKDSFGIDTVMTAIKHPRVMITGVLADRRPVELHLFRNYQSASEILGIKNESSYELPLPPEEQHIWEVGRATGAAPTYFRAFGPYLDGGLVANNPTLDALTEIYEHTLALKATGREEEASPVSVVVSLGTGVVPVTQIRNIDVFRPERLLDSARLVFGISALGNLLVDQATASDGRVVDRARAWCSSIGVPFFRFSPRMSEEFGLDEKSDEKLCQMLWETKVYMRSNIGLMKELANLLNEE